MFEAVARGEIQVSVLAELKGCLDETNAEELFAMCRRKSFRQVQQLLAARFPKADLKDSVRRAPDRMQPAVPQPSAVTLLAEAPALDEGNGPTPAASTSTAPPLKATTTPPPLPIPTSTPASTPPSYSPARAAQRQVEPLSQDRFAVRFTADAEFLALLEEVRGLRAHRDPSADLLAVLKAGLQAHHRELLKQRFAVGRTPRQKRQPAPKLNPGPGVETGRAVDPTGEGSRRHTPAEVAREVYERDCGQCTFVSATGRRCTARRQLEIDHIVPWVVSRDDSPTNLRMRCRAHNQLGARRYFGKAYMRAVAQRVASRRRPDRD